MADVLSPEGELLVRHPAGRTAMKFPGARGPIMLGLRNREYVAARRAQGFRAAITNQNT